MSTHDVTRGPSEIPTDAAPSTDVQDEDEFDEELLRLKEDRDAAENGDANWDAVENRTVQLLSDIRRTRPRDDEDDTDGDGE